MSATAQIDQNREALSRMEDEGTVYVHEIWPEVKLWTKELCSFPSSTLFQILKCGILDGGRQTSVGRLPQHLSTES